MKTVRRDPLRTRGTGRRPWGPQALGLLVLFLSFLIIYHGTEGSKMLKDLDMYLSGSAAKTTASSSAASSAPQDPSSVLASNLTAMTTGVKAGKWTQVGQAVQTAESAWNQAQAAYASAGVAPVDMNALTGDLAELQMAVAAHDSKDALTQIANAQKTFAYMQATKASAASPSLDAMSQVVQDLNQALKNKDIARATSDAQTLSQMLSTIKQGF